MSVVSINEIKIPRSAEIQIDWSRHYTRTYRVITDDPDDDPLIVAAALPVGLGYTYANAAGTKVDLYAFVNRIRYDCVDEDGKGWLVTIEYGSFDPNQRPENPLQQPIQVRGGFAPYTEIADQDINGNAITNSAGDYFDPPVEMDDSRPILSASMNVQSFDPVAAAAFRDATNGDTWLGAPAGTVKVKDIQYERLWHYTCGWYFRVDFQFEFNPNTWNKIILDQGLKSITGGTAQPILLNGQPATAPVPLDGNGGVLPVGGTPVFLQFQVYQPQDFSAFGLDALGSVFGY